MPPPRNLLATGGDLEGEVDLAWEPVYGRDAYLGESAEDSKCPWTQFYVGAKSSCTATRLLSERFMRYFVFIWQKHHDDESQEAKHTEKTNPLRMALTLCPMRATPDKEDHAEEHEYHAQRRCGIAYLPQPDASYLEQDAGCYPCDSIGFVLRSHNCPLLDRASMFIRRKYFPVIG